MKGWKKKLIITLAVIFTPIVALAVAGTLFLNSILDKVSVGEGDVPKHDLMVNEKLNDDVMNIALFGLDCRNDDYSGCRSDVMQVISYNKKVNEVTVTSVVRDSYVEIGDRGFDKINHAYAFGGPELAIQTMNKAFDLDIKNYVTVDFWIVEDIINALNGVEVNIDSSEVELLNGYINDLNLNSPDGEKESFISGGGIQTLSGRQAVAYMRIRYVGDGDFERMERQRTVMEAALQKLTTISLTDMIDMVNEMLPNVRTNFKSGEIISLLTSVVTKGFPVMNEFQLPARDGGVGTMIDGVYYFVPNTLLSNVEEFHKIVYPNNNYEPSEILIDMSKELETYLY